MISPERTEENGALMRASALAQLNSESPLTSLSDPPEYGGHLRNKYRPYPLSLIPFDLSEPYEASEYLTIRPYDEACQIDYLGEDWVNMYKGGLIIDEQDFYDTKDKEWAKLDLVDEFRRQTGKVIGMASRSQASSESQKDGATTPDASLMGYVKDPSCPSGWKRQLYAVVELKWMELATHLAGEEKKQTDEKTLIYLCQEGVFQTMWYVILGYAISSCTFGLSIANEYFYRVVYLDRNPTSKNPVLALEADSEFLQKARPDFGDPPDGYSIEELAGLTDFWASPPNRLVSDRANSILNKEARYRLDATILLFLARAASLPTQRFLKDSHPILDSAFDTSCNSNEETHVLDHLSAAPYPEINNSDPVDIDLDDIDSESGELTLAAYRDRLAMFGVRVKLVTREEMDVLLARR
ncbi:hypothetical protein D1P53_006338 [Cryptococcus gattii VGV]|nr:hypothetical protein D1P53_006338 [Cryptococcus gattii VGV]